MSCGGTKFVCGMRRFDKHSVASDRPQNQQLHNETEKQLADLIRLREQQDQGIFTPVSHPINPSDSSSSSSSSFSSNFSSFK